MAKDYQIQIHNGSTKLVTGTVLKIGKGKHAKDALGIRRSDEGLESWYYLDHVPSGYLVSGGFVYQAVARHVGEQMIEALGDKLLTNSIEELVRITQGPLDDFIFYCWLPNIQEKLNQIKRNKGLLITLEDFIHGSYYQALLSDRNGGSIPSQSSDEYYESLLVGDKTLGWVPTTGSQGLDGGQLAALIDGRRTYREVIRYSPTGKRN